MSADALHHAGLIVAVGLAVGWGASVTGLGAGLSLPLLAVLGLPLPGALLAVKLPVTACDIAAALGEGRRGDACAQRPSGATLRADAAWRLGLAALSGALAAWAVLRWPAPTLALAAPLLALIAWATRHPRGSHRPGWLDGQALAWGAYVGGCGLGAGLLWRLPLPWTTAPSRPAGAAPLTGASGVALRAAANAGALAVLLVCGQEATSTVCLLAAAQGSGAWLAARLTSGHCHGHTIAAQ